GGNLESGLRARPVETHAPPRQGCAANPRAPRRLQAPANVLDPARPQTAAAPGQKVGRPLARARAPRLPRAPAPRRPARRAGSVTPSRKRKRRALYDDTASPSLTRAAPRTLLMSDHATTTYERPPAASIMRNLGMNPDPWQKEVLEGEHARLLLNCCRQSGK